MHCIVYQSDQNTETGTGEPREEKMEGEREVEEEVEEEGERHTQTQTQTQTQTHTDTHYCDSGVGDCDLDVSWDGTGSADSTDL